MKTWRHAFSVAGLSTALLATSAAQLQLKREPLPQAKPALPADEAKKVAPAIQQRVIIGGAGGQIIVNGGAINFNGVNAFVGANGVVVFGDGAGEAKPAPDPAGPQVLDYVDGQRLHGTLGEFDLAGGRVLWKRPDTAEPLSIPLEQVGRWTSDNAPAPDTAGKATMKFVGGDWVTGKVVALQGDEVQFQLADESVIKTARQNVEWIHFSRTSAVETYEGPTGLAGWNTSGTWTYRDGALRASSPTPISRLFQTLPDQVEYRMTVNQGETFNAFTISLHSRTPQVRSLTRNMIQIMLRANTLNLWGSFEGNFKTVQADLSKVLGDVAARPKGPLFFQIFEDYTGGKLTIYINKKKAGEWTIDKGEAGKNGGAFQFQPTSWSGENEQSLSMIRILPWDGRPPVEDESRPRDLVSVTGGELKQGKVTGWDGKTLQMTVDNAPVSVPVEQVGLVQFQRAEKAAPEAAPGNAVAQVRLAGRGELAAVKLDWRDGKFQIGTRFGGELSLNPSGLAEVEFNRAAPNQSLTAENLLVFRNGDRLRGTLEGASADGKVLWRTNPAGPAAAFAVTNLAGLQLAPQDGNEPGQAAVRFRNGDWLGGKFVTLDRQQAVIEAAQLGQISAPRAAVKALYFGGAAGPSVSDGVADHAIWERGLETNPGTAATRKKLAESSNPWSYFAGSFSRGRGAGNELAYNRVGGIQLGRLFENLAQRVELSFTASAGQGPLYFSAQVFSEPNNMGYMMHLSTNVLSVYDMNPRARLQGRGFAQQQFQFPKEMAVMARERRVRLFADRPTGRVTFMVDGVVVGQIGPKVADGQRNLGRGFMISPQANTAFKISDLWVGPWNGVVPGKADGNSPETVALANGDEVQGTVEQATPTTLNVKSDVGPLELPMERLTMIDFGGAHAEPRAGTRVHLAGQGTLTVSAWKIEGGMLTGRSEVIGDVKVPLKAVQEIVFATPPAPAPAAPAAPALPPVGGALVPAK